MTDPAHPSDHPRPPRTAPGGDPHPRGPHGRDPHTRAPGDPAARFSDAHVDGARPQGAVPHGTRLRDRPVHHVHPHEPHQPTQPNQRHERHRHDEHDTNDERDEHVLRDVRDEHEHRHCHRTHGRGAPARLGHLLRPHTHHASEKVDEAVETSADGLRTLWISLLVLALTAVLQAGVVVLSDSVALLGDTVHDAADALTAVPLAIAFLLGRRAATRSFTYGYGRAEDLAGVAVLATVAASAVLAAVTAVDRLLHPQQVGHVWAVAAAAVVGCLGNEWVARYRIRTGRRIGSAALVADGVHARADGLTSLAVLLGAGGSALGWQVADPLVGLVITAVMLAVLCSSVHEVGRRLMDGVEPALVDAAERGLRGVDGVRAVGALRMRWVGHALRAEAEVAVDGSLTVAEGHLVAEAAEQALKRAVPRLVAATVHVDAAEPAGPEEGTVAAESAAVRAALR